MRVFNTSNIPVKNAMLANKTKKVAEGQGQFTFMVSFKPQKWKNL
jgi:hypothetical protein